jgi:hypothetical protein
MWEVEYTWYRQYRVKTFDDHAAAKRFFWWAAKRNEVKKAELRAVTP